VNSELIGGKFYQMSHVTALSGQMFPLAVFRVSVRRNSPTRSVKVNVLLSCTHGEFGSSDKR